MNTLAIQKYLRLPLLLGIAILAVLLALWLAQQNNVNSLAQQIDALQHQIDALPATVTPKDKLALEKDRLTLEKDRVNAQNAIYGTLVQALGGAFFVVTAYFTYRNVRATEANVRAAEEKSVTEWFSKAIELLGSEKLKVRLGGIYALERIAKDSPKDHWTIMEVLTSFVREKSPLRPSYKQDSRRITTEVQAALTVIKRRDASKEQERQRIELPITKLLGADLSRGSLSRADFNTADLRAVLLIEADLSRANLRGAFLNAAFLNAAFLRGADLGGANLRGANLSGTDLSGVIALTSEQISGAFTDEKTKLPDYLQSPKSSQPKPPEPQKP